MNNCVTYPILPIKYDYLFNDSPKPITEYLKMIPRREVLKLALNISNFTTNENWIGQLNWLPIAAPIKYYCCRKIQEHERSLPYQYVLYTPLTGLMLLKYIFSIHPNEHQLNGNKWHAGILKAITLVNSELIEEGAIHNDCSFNLFFKSVKHYRYELDNRIEFYAALYRAKWISEFLKNETQKDWVDLREELLKRLKFKSIRDYLSERLYIFKDIKLNPTKRNQILLFHKDYKEFQSCAIKYTEYIPLDTNQDFTAFKKRPFVQFENGEFAIIRNSFVANLIYTKLKFELLECYAEIKKGKAQTFFGIYNKDFLQQVLFNRILKYSFSSEKYLCLTEDECIQRIEVYKRLHPGTVSNNYKENLIDGYVRYEGKILLIECKGKTISLRALGDKKQLKNDIETDIIKLSDKGKRTATRQLIDNCERIIKRESFWDNDIPDSYSIYPLLVVDDIGFSANGFNQFVKEATSEFVSKHEMVRPFTVLDIDTFILISELIRSKKLNIFREIVNYHKHISGTNPFDHNISFAIYLRSKYETRLPKAISKWLRNL